MNQGQVTDLAAKKIKHENVYTDEEIFGRAAWYYYHDGLTQNEIGERLGISRVKVSRILDKGRQLGLIEVKVNSNEEGCFALETELEQIYGLSEVRVIPELPDTNPTDRISQCANQFLMSRLQESDLLAIGWGEMVVGTLQRLARKMVLLNASMVSLSGGVSAYMEGIGNGSIKADIHLIPAPLVVSTKEVRDILRKEKPIHDTLAMAITANFALVGIGALDKDASLVRSGYVSQQEIELYRRQGAVGDILGIFFDINGGIVDVPLHDRIIGTNLTELRKIPNVIGAAVGDIKLDAILGALRGKHINTLLTDEPTAISLVREKDKR